MCVRVRECVRAGAHLDEESGEQAARDVARSVAPHDEQSIERDRDRCKLRECDE
jgi:hypothetical protein